MWWLRVAPASCVLPLCDFFCQCDSTLSPLFSLFPSPPSLNQLSPHPVLPISAFTKTPTSTDSDTKESWRVVRVEEVCQQVKQFNEELAMSLEAIAMAILNIASDSVCGGGSSKTSCVSSLKQPSRSGTLSVPRLRSDFFPQSCTLEPVC